MSEKTPDDWGLDEKAERFSMNARNVKSVLKALASDSSMLSFVKAKESGEDLKDSIDVPLVLGREKRYAVRESKEEADPKSADVGVWNSDSEDDEDFVVESDPEGFDGEESGDSNGFHDLDPDDLRGELKLLYEDNDAPLPPGLTSKFTSSLNDDASNLELRTEQAARSAPQGEYGITEGETFPAIGEADSNADREWKDFVQSVLFPRAEDSVSVVTDDDDPEDADYNYLADSSSALKPIEIVEEHREDRGVSVSKRELNGLWSDDVVLVEPESHDGHYTQMPSIEEAKKQVESAIRSHEAQQRWERERALVETAHLRRGAFLDPQLPQPLQFPVGSSEASAQYLNFGQQQQHVQQQGDSRQRQVSPDLSMVASIAATPSEIPWEAVLGGPLFPSPVITRTQLGEIEKQLNVHIDLLLKSYLQGIKDYKQAARSPSALSKARELLIEVVNESRGFRESWSKKSLTATSSGFASPSEDDRALVFPQRKGRRLRSARQSAMNRERQQARDRLQLAQENALRECWNRERVGAECPFSSELVDSIQPFLDKALLVLRGEDDVDALDALLQRPGSTALPTRSKWTNKGRKDHSYFAPAEDSLLAIGMQRFGNDWRKIQGRLLPSRLVSQIAVRVKNRCSNRAGDNVIRRLKNSLNRISLSQEERFFFFDAIQRRGLDFHSIATLFPSRHPVDLRVEFLKMIPNLRKFTPSYSWALGAEIARLRGVAPLPMPRSLLSANSREKRHPTKKRKSSALSSRVVSGTKQQRRAAERKFAEFERESLEGPGEEETTGFEQDRLIEESDEEFEQDELMEDGSEDEDVEKDRLASQESLPDSHSSEEDAECEYDPACSAIASSAGDGVVTADQEQVPAPGRAWNRDEDFILLNSVKEVGVNAWDVVSGRLNGERSREDAEKRYAELLTFQRKMRSLS